MTSPPVTFQSNVSNIINYSLSVHSSHTDTTNKAKKIIIMSQRKTNNTRLKRQSVVWAVMFVTRKRQRKKAEKEKTQKKQHKANISQQRSYAAVFGRDDELGDLSSVDTENVLHLSCENVPDDDGEVHSSRHQRALVIAGGDLVRI